MPIITPAYPATCASQNVTALTQMVMIEELKKAAVIVDKVIIGMAEWSGLFEQHGFFHKYRYYMQVTTSSDSVASQIQWYVLAPRNLDDPLYNFIYRSGTVESQMRQLVLMLEHVDSLTLAHPFSEGFEKVSYCISDDEVCAVAQGENWQSINKHKKEDIKGKAVHSTTFYIGLAANNCASIASMICYVPLMP
jgi:poly(A) polymerase